MNRKFLGTTMMVFALVFGILTVAAYGEHGKSKSKCSWDVKDKLFYKAHFILKNQEELGISDEQAEQIKALKIEAKKDVIRKKAEIDLLAVDIKSELYKDTIDAGAINALIDRKYDLKKEKTKALVSSYAKLKDILTAEQKEKMKALWKKCSKKEKR